MNPLTSDGELHGKNLQKFVNNNQNSPLHETVKLTGRKVTNT